MTAPCFLPLLVQICFWSYVFFLVIMIQYKIIYDRSRKFGKPRKSQKNKILIQLLEMIPSFNVFSSTYYAVGS